MEAAWNAIFEEIFITFGDLLVLLRGRGGSLKYCAAAHEKRKSESKGSGFASEEAQRHCNNNWKVVWLVGGNEFILKYIDLISVFRMHRFWGMKVKLSAWDFYQLQQKSPPQVTMFSLASCKADWVG